MMLREVTVTRCPDRGMHMLVASTTSFVGNRIRQQQFLCHQLYHIHGIANLGNILKYIIFFSKYRFL
jgi:hypothetical protein